MCLTHAQFFSYLDILFFFYFIDSLGILATTSLSCVGVSTLKSGLKKINWVQLHTVYIFFAPSSSPPPKKTLCWSVKSFLCSCRVPHPIKVFPPRANRMSRKWQRSLIFRYNTLWSRSWGILLSILCHKKEFGRRGISFVDKNWVIQELFLIFIDTKMAVLQGKVMPKLFRKRSTPAEGRDGPWPDPSLLLTRSK